MRITITRTNATCPICGKALEVGTQGVTISYRNAGNRRVHVECAKAERAKGRAAQAAQWGQTNGDKP